MAFSKVSVTLTLLVYTFVLLFCAAPAVAQSPIIMGYLTDESTSFTKKPVTLISPTWYFLSRKKGVVGEENGAQIEAAKENMIRVVPLVQSFNARTLHGYIKTQEGREKLVLQMVPILLKPGIDGLQLDFENLYPEDKENFNQFMALLYDVTSSMDKMLMIALPAKTSADTQYRGFDFSFIGAHANYVVLMAYDENVRHPGPIASMDWVQETLNYAQAAIPSEKLLLGIPFYGRYWQRGRGGKGLSQQKIEKFYTLYARHEPQASDQGTFFKTEKGVVWYEDEQHLKAKIDLLLKENLAGMAIWRLGYEKSSFWQVIMEKLAGTASPAIPAVSSEISLVQPAAVQ